MIATLKSINKKFAPENFVYQKSEQFSWITCGKFDFKRKIIEKSIKELLATKCVSHEKKIDIKVWKLQSDDDGLKIDIKGQKGRWGCEMK